MKVKLPSAPDTIPEKYRRRKPVKRTKTEQDVRAFEKRVERRRKKK